MIKREVPIHRFVVAGTHLFLHALKGHFMYGFERLVAVTTLANGKVNANLTILFILVQLALAVFTHSSRPQRNECKKKFRQLACNK